MIVSSEYINGQMELIMSVAFFCPVLAAPNKHNARKKIIGFIIKIYFAIPSRSAYRIS
jgi:hypothetical protein